jgi:hypothetical protein
MIVLFAAFIMILLKNAGQARRGPLPAKGMSAIPRWNSVPDERGDKIAMCFKMGRGDRGAAAKKTVRVE